MKKLPLEIGSPLVLAKKFGGSNHASLRRYVEQNKKRCALIVLDTKAEANGFIPLRNYFQSKSFAASFGNVSLPETFGIESPFIKDYKSNRRLHKNGNAQIETEEGFTEFAYIIFSTTIMLLS